MNDAVNTLAVCLYFLFYPSRFRELETEGKSLKSNFPYSFGPETLAKPLGMGIPSEINDESRPRKAGEEGELQEVLHSVLRLQSPSPPILLFIWD